ncbi:hypothetical protein RclHR1_03540009 [Rhizophagus clarus]|uniref:Uncharacterized protein n=1 Tax=Rhizophagus clarus TaxID=94130 RepID=A0A2Z6RC19_9GLOM|nr:hypothetical protein RclHR1_03540009 [Rhizophagus clarus]GES78167.1 hypothetical protein RCL_jg29652.t1 [Rhizophagus clarus]
MIKNSDNLTDKNYEKYAKEIDYKNKWNIEVNQKENQEEDYNKGKKEGEDGGNYDYQDSMIKKFTIDSRN